MTALVLVGATVAQSPDGNQPQPRFIGPSAPIAVDDVVARMMTFDKNKDGKITKDELPERMHGLFAHGDTNKDGALDRDEITKLVSSPAGAGAVSFGFNVARRAGLGGAATGFGAGPGPGGGFRTTGGPVGAGGAFRVGAGPVPDNVAGVVDDLKLAGKKMQLAKATVRAHEENVRKLMDQARSELLEKMKEILSEDEFNDFIAALDRPRGAAVFLDPGPAGAPAPGIKRQVKNH
jgi:hypothetical protein